MSTQALYRRTCALVVCAAMLGAAAPAPAQESWSRLIGAYRAGTAALVRATPDGGVLWEGSVRLTRDTTSVVPIAKLGPDGGLIWSETLAGAQPVTLTGMTPSADGGCLVVGSLTPGGMSYPTGWAARLDADGRLLWQHQYAAAVGIRFYDACQTADGGWAMAGSAVGLVGGACELLVVRLDADGSLVWDISLGSEGPTGWGWSVRAAPDGTLLVAGQEGCFQVPGGPPWIVKLTAQGQVLWQKYLLGIGIGQASEIGATADGGCVVAGSGRPDSVSPANGWVARVDATGVLAWQRTFGGASSESLFTSMRVDSSGAVALFGSRRSLTLPGARVWLMKLDGQGAFLWEHTYEGASSITRGNLDLRPGGGFFFTSPVEPACDAGGMMVAAADASGGLPGGCAPLDDWSSVISDAGLSLGDAAAVPVPRPLTVSDTAVTATALALDDWPRCPSTCTISCAASVPAGGHPGVPVSFSGSASPSQCTTAPAFRWVFGDGTGQDGAAGTHAYARAATYTWNLYASADGQCCSQSGTIAIVPCPAVAVTPATVPQGYVGQRYTQTFTASGGSAPYAWSVTAGSLPPGLTLGGGGALSGTPSLAGSFSFQVTATDGGGCTGSQDYTLAIGAYDLGFQDDRGAAQICVNSASGDYIWVVLKGPGAGRSYSGTGRVTDNSTYLRLMSPPRTGPFIFVTFFKGARMAVGSYVNGAVRSRLWDSNTADDPPDLCE